MRASIFSKHAKLSSDAVSDSVGGAGSFSMEKEEDFSIIQGNETKETNVLPVKIMDIPPVEIETIEDTKGRLSTIIDNYCICTGEVCIPLEITQILPQVKSLKRYDIVEYAGKRFATADIVREDVVSTYRDEIIRSLGEGLSYEERLEKDFTYKGVTMKNLVLTAKEQSYLISAFRNYHAYLYYSTEFNSLMLRVDGITEQEE